MAKFPTDEEFVKNVRSQADVPRVRSSEIKKIIEALNQLAEAT